MAASWRGPKPASRSRFLEADAGEIFGENDLAGIAFLHLGHVRIQLAQAPVEAPAPVTAPAPVRAAPPPAVAETTAPAMQPPPSMPVSTVPPRWRRR